MDWLSQYWPYLLAVLLLVVVAARLAIMLPRFRQPARHSGERTIRVVGVGGAGGNAINHMIKAKHPGVEYIAVNTDAQVLDESRATRRVQIGQQLTKGLGAGGDAAIGREAAEEDVDELGRMVAGADLVFIAAGLGGGTGSGAAPVIAAQARETGALTVGVVTKPFSFEGTGRRRVADIAEAELQATVDTLLLVENDRVLNMVGEDTSMLDAFTVVNEVLARTVRAIVDVMTVPGLINLDFADIRAVMRNGGAATTGIGWASGPDRAVEAARGAVTNPLLDHDISGAGAILLNVAGASSMTMREVTKAADEIRAAADQEATIIFGTIFDDRLGDELRVTVIATKFRDREAVAESAVATESVAAPVEPTVRESPVAAAAPVAEEAPVAQEAPFSPALAAAPFVASALVEESPAEKAVDEAATEEPMPVAPSAALGTSLGHDMPWMQPEATPEASADDEEIRAAPELVAPAEEPAPTTAFDDQWDASEPSSFEEQAASAESDEDEDVAPGFASPEELAAARYIEATEDGPDIATAEAEAAPAAAVAYEAYAGDNTATPIDSEPSESAGPEEQAETAEPIGYLASAYDDAPTAVEADGAVESADTEEHAEAAEPVGYLASADDVPIAMETDEIVASAVPEADEQLAEAVGYHAGESENGALPAEAEAEAIPESVGDEAQAPTPEPVGFHVAAEEPMEPAWWLPTRSYTNAETPEASATPEATASASVGTALAEMNEAPPVASYEPQAAATSVEEPEAATVPVDLPAASASSEESEAPTLPPSLASILIDEAAPSAEPTIEASSDSAEPVEEPVAPGATAPQPAQTTQRSEPVRQPTSALVGRFWSRVGKSRR